MSHIKSIHFYIFFNSTPTMAKEKLIEELSISRYSSIALVMIAENVRQEK